MQSPVAISSQLLKCVMKREHSSAQTKAIKYTLSLGDKVANSTFLMTALQSSR